MSARKPIFDAIKAARDGASFAQAEVSRIDALLDSLGVPMEGGREVSQKGLDLIKAFEGLSLKAYPDPATGGEPITIGYGATGGIKLGTVWTQDQADKRLAEDVQRFADGVSKALEGALTTQSQFDAMVSLAYNVGLGNFGGSTLLKKHKAGDYLGAGGEFPKWNKAAGKVMGGLVRRRAAEAQLYKGLAG